MVGLLFTSLATVDRLLKYQYEQHHEAWVRDGEPRGFFFTPEGGGSTWAYAKYFRRIVRVTPEWIKRDPRAEELFKSAMLWNNLGVKSLWLLVPVILAAMALTR